MTYSIVFTFHTCDRIALRWQEKAITTDNVGYGRYVMDVKILLKISLLIRIMQFG